MREKTPEWFQSLPIQRSLSENKIKPSQHEILTESQQQKLCQK